MRFRSRTWPDVAVGDRKKETAGGYCVGAIDGLYVGSEEGHGVYAHGQMLL